MPLSINALHFFKINKTMSFPFKLLTCSLFFVVLSNCAHLENLSHSNSNAQNFQISADPVLANVISVTPIKKSSAANNGDQSTADLELNSTNNNFSSNQEFQVIFEYKDQTYSTLLPFDPGATLLIQATLPKIQNAEPIPNVFTYSNNDVYILAPAGINRYPTPYFGFYTGFPVYLNRGYYPRPPGKFYLNQGKHNHFPGSRGRGRK